MFGKERYLSSQNLGIKDWMDGVLRVGFRLRVSIDNIDGVLFWICSSLGGRYVCMIIRRY